MKYVLETKFKCENSPGSLQSSIGFNTELYPDDTFPALIFINAEGVNYKRNKVSFNGNFLGYLSARTPITILEVDNRVIGNLQHFGNRLTMVACDHWGNTTPTSQSVLDDFKVITVQLAYSSKKIQLEANPGNRMSHERTLEPAEYM